MLISKMSPLTGKMNSMELDITQSQLELIQSNAVSIQAAVPALSSAEREFLTTGYTEADWKEIFSDKETN